MYKVNFIYNRKAGRHFYLSKGRREEEERQEGKEERLKEYGIHDVLEWKFLYESHHYL